MSLILEALRKSEAERRRGEAPNIFVELPPSPRNRQARFPLWAWLLLAGAALLVTLWFARGDSQRAPVRTPAVVSAAIAPKPVAAVLPPVPRLSPPPEAVATIAPAVPSKLVVPLRQIPVSATPDPAATESPPPAPRPVAAAIAAPEVSETMQLSDLSADERKALPPLKISMHMWNDDPAQRFVIVDGNRLHQGDRIGDAVVTAITTDGVVLDWNGRRLKLPLR